MSIRRRHVVIDNGPSLERLQDAAKYHDDRTVRLPVVFQVGGDEKVISARITSVEVKPGSGVPTIIAGNLMTDKSLFTGRYDAHTRSGFLDITPRTKP